MSARNCPYCNKAPSSDEKGVKPFCSERCKLLDLGSWLDESYSVEAEEQDEPE